MKEESSQLLDPKATARLLGISQRTLYRWRQRKVGPPVIVMPGGTIIRYAREGVMAWLKRQTQIDPHALKATEKAV